MSDIKMSKGDEVKASVSVVMIILYIITVSIGSLGWFALLSLPCVAYLWHNLIAIADRSGV